MTSDWPAITIHDELCALPLKAEVWAPGIRAICQRHGLRGEPRLFHVGRLVLCGVGDRVIKLFGPWEIGQYHTKRRVLGFLTGRLTSPSPELVVADVADGWGYVVMTRVPGQTIQSVYAELTAPERLDLMRDVAVLAREMPAQPIDQLAGLEPWWPGFIAAQRAA